MEVLCEEVLAILRQFKDVIIFEVSEITRGAHYPNLEFSDELSMTASGEYDRLCALSPLWSTDPYQPLTDPGKAEQAFAGRVEMEIAFVTSEVGKKRQQNGPKGPILCPLCPFRTFSKKCHLNCHIKTYHSDKVDFAATGLVRRVTQELHNADVELSNLRGDILRCNTIQRSVMYIREWIGEVPADIQRDLCSASDITRFVSMVFRGDIGPVYTLKCNAGPFYRLNSQVFFDSEFANLLLSTAMTTQGRLKGIKNKLVSYFTSRGHPCPGLLNRKTDFFYDILSAVMEFDEVSSLRSRWVGTASSRGEFTILSHDGTYKCAKSLISTATSSTYRGGRSNKAIHTLRGRSGSVPGISVEKGEDRESCLHATESILPINGRSTCLFCSRTMCRIFYLSQEMMRESN